MDAVAVAVPVAVIALCVAVCTFEIARTVVYCTRTGRRNKQLNAIGAKLRAPSDLGPDRRLDEIYNLSAQIIELAEEQRAMESAWWMRPYSRLLVEPIKRPSHP